MLVGDTIVLLIQMTMVSYYFVYAFYVMPVFFFFFFFALYQTIQLLRHRIQLIYRQLFLFL